MMFQTKRPVRYDLVALVASIVASRVPLVAACAQIVAYTDCQTAAGLASSNCNNLVTDTPTL
ncbi:hypothetical protein HK405_012954, partial [Cladochytrium tenue]